MSQVGLYDQQVRRQISFMFQEIFLQCLGNLMGKKETLPLTLKVSPMSVVVLLGSPWVPTCLLLRLLYNEKREMGHSESLKAVPNTTTRFKTRTLTYQLIN